MVRAVGCVVILLSAAGFVSRSGADEGPPGEADQALLFDERVRPLLASYCGQCHAGDDPKAGMDVERYDSLADIAGDRATWEKIAQNVTFGVMPPPGEDRPSEEEVAFLSGWIENEFIRLDCGNGRSDPGRVTIRRLNRAEYRNTVRDLLGIDFEPADDFPSDDVGYGFDNIGDVLSLPPVLLERYLDAADEIAGQAIVAVDPEGAPQRRFASELLAGDGETTGEGVRGLYSNGEVSAQVNLERQGKYVLRVSASADRAGPEPPRMSLKLDGAELALLDVEARRRSPEKYEIEFEAEPGERTVAAAFTNDYYQPDAPERRDRDRNLYIHSIEVAGPIAIAPESLPESHRRMLMVDPGGDDRAARAAVILRPFVERAYRRGANDDDIGPLVRLVDMAGENGDTFEQGLQIALSAVLVSPHFLFRVEIDELPGDASDVHSLGDYELASRLSYFLWSTMPDDELFELAAKRTLHENDVLESQVRRMLADPKAAALTENFAVQWLQLRNLDSMTPDPGRFPAFDEALRGAMLRETELFFEAIVREDRSIRDLLDADFTFVNERLARHYGIEGVAGEDFQRVSLDRVQRGGVLTQASVLTVTSNPTRTSPVKRGKWILEQILGTPPPAPPPDVPELADDERGALSGTLRQRMEQHRSDASCAVCHSRMDPLGFGLENYDAIGAWRTSEGEFPVDSSGVLPDGRTFDGPSELKGILNGQEKLFARAFTERLLTYALGRGLESFDRCAVRDIVAAAAHDDYRFSRLVLEIVRSEPFLMRRGESP